MNLYNADCLEVLRKTPDCSIDIIFTDPPYALGSEVIILPNGKPEYKKASDFMSKWEQPTGEFWEAWFVEANRVLKYGGRVLMFGLDRQLMLYKYYACFSGLNETQSLYWYFISNFPKSADLSKMIDKHFGEDREIVSTKTKKAGNMKSNSYGKGGSYEDINIDITSPKNILAQKYEGYKYSIAPLKQTCETIMVFQKPYKTGSCLHDTLTMENGDNTITCGALDIESNRVDFTSEADEMEAKAKNQHSKFGTKPMENNIVYGDYSMIQPKNYVAEGRYPAQTFIDSEVGKVLDMQSGVLKVAGNQHEQKQHNGSYFGGVSISKEQTYKDIGGASKILQKCDYDSETDFDLFVYCPKVSKSERNRGLKGSKKKYNPLMANDAWSLENMKFSNTNPSENYHPTVKPVSLIKKILSLFKTPNKQVIMDCFMGSGSIGVGCKELGLDFIGIELNEDYFDISQKRIDKATINIQNKLF